MTVTHFLATLSDLGTMLSARGDRLRYEASAGVLTAELREALPDHKATIFANLRDGHHGDDGAAVYQPSEQPQVARAKGAGSPSLREQFRQRKNAPVETGSTPEQEANFSSPILLMRSDTCESENIFVAASLRVRTFRVQLSSRFQM